MRRLLGSFLTLSCAALLASGASAQVYNSNVTVSTALTTVAQSSAVSVLDLGTSGINGLVSNQPVSFGSGSTAGLISYTGTSGIYSGNVTGVTAAPYGPNGLTTSNYFAAEPSGNVTIKYAADQHYFGMMWGSVDSYNTVSFYEGNSLVEQIPGKAISALANGSTGAGNSYFVNMNFGGSTAFDRVVFTSTQPALEFNVVAFSTTTQAITAAQVAAAGNLGTAQSITVHAAPFGASPLLALLVAAFRRRKRAAA